MVVTCRETSEQRRIISSRCQWSVYACCNQLGCFHTRRGRCWSRWMLRAIVELLREHRNSFCLEDGERGETDLIELDIDTGDTTPKRQRVRRIPFAVRKEVARQFKIMQGTGVIQPSYSPWASAVVLVRKKDGSHRFCVDYRNLNSVTKLDSYPLPRIDDLLDQLDQSLYFSKLDLASGYWQIWVHRDSVPKTTFITPQGLFEFRVMPRLSFSALCRGS